MSGEGIETAESHRNTPAHFKMARQFQQYQELYLLRVLPCLTKEEELRKTLEDLSMSGKRTQVDLDLERLEEIHSSIKSVVQTIESSLDWTNTNALISAVKEFQQKLKDTETIVEQGKSCETQSSMKRMSNCSIGAKTGVCMAPLGECNFKCPHVQLLLRHLNFGGM